MTLQVIFQFYAPTRRGAQEDARGGTLLWITPPCKSFGGLGLKTSDKQNGSRMQTARQDVLYGCNQSFDYC